MKIGILTISNGQNYGNRLQNYALQEVLRGMGASPETIRNTTNSLDTTNAIKLHKWLIKQIVKQIMGKRQFAYREYKRIKKFDEFTQKYIRQSKYTVNNNNIPENLSTKYDYFVSGSDQVWNPFFSCNSDVDFLNFARKEQRISYAPSFGVDKIPDEYIESYKKNLNGMNALSVRENVGQKIINELTGKSAEVLVDPTLLLGRNIWSKCEKKPAWIDKNEKYLLSYFISGEDEATKLKIKDMGEKYGLKVITLLDPSNKDAYLIDPFEFIWLVHHSSLVCTNSFHGTVFSILMGSPFISLKDYDRTAHMNSRMKTLFEIFNIDENNVYEPIKISNNQVDGVLLEHRKKANEYLAKYLCNR
jgi:hypothetical protein